MSAGTAIYVTPKLNASESALSMAPLIAFGEQLKRNNAGSVQTAEFKNWLPFFNTVVATESGAGLKPVGYSMSLATRFVGKANFATAAKRAELLAALVAATRATPTLLFDITTPASFPGDNTTSVTPAWRESVYHVTSKVLWNWNATTAEKQAAYEIVNDSINNLRAITPDASYSVRSFVKSTAICH